MIPGGPDGDTTRARGGPDAERRMCIGGEPGSGREATGTDRYWLAQAIELSRRCPPSRSAFAVGAVIVAADGSVLATGYSREGSPHDHAEEAALAKLASADPPGGTAGSGLAQGGVAGSELAQRGAAGPGLGLPGVTLYSSLEPCASRASRPRP